MQNRGNAVKEVARRAPTAIRGEASHSAIKLAPRLREPHGAGAGKVSGERNLPRVTQDSVASRGAIDAPRRIRGAPHRYTEVIAG